MILEKISYKDFDDIFLKLVDSFIEDERRDKVDAYALLDNDRYTVYHVIDGGIRVGFVTVWQLDVSVFIEHFVIFEQYRNKGYGAQTLELIKQNFPNIILEVEPPQTDIARRRIEFYRRSGLVVNDKPYLQPSYRKNGQAVPLVIMSYPDVLSNFDEAVDELYRTVYGINTLE